MSGIRGKGNNNGAKFKSKVIKIDGAQDDGGECEMNTIECGRCYSVNRSIGCENVERKTTMKRKDQEDRTIARRANVDEKIR